MHKGTSAPPSPPAPGKEQDHIAGHHCFPGMAAVEGGPGCCVRCWFVFGAVVRACGFVWGRCVCLWLCLYVRERDREGGVGLCQSVWEPCLYMCKLSTCTLHAFVSVHISVCIFVYVTLQTLYAFPGTHVHYAEWEASVMKPE